MGCGASSCKVLADECKRGNTYACSAYFICGCTNFILWVQLLLIFLLIKTLYVIISNTIKRRTVKTQMEDAPQRTTPLKKTEGSCSSTSKSLEIPQRLNTPQPQSRHYSLEGRSLLERRRLHRKSEKSRFPSVRPKIGRNNQEQVQLAHAP